MRARTAASALPPAGLLILASSEQDDPTARIVWTARELEALLRCGSDLPQQAKPGAPFSLTPFFTPRVVSQDPYVDTPHDAVAMSSVQRLTELEPCEFGHHCLVATPAAPTRILKLVRGVSGERGSFDRLRAEIDDMAKTRHVNVLATLDAKSSDRIEVLSEHAAGLTLHALLQTRALSLAVLLRILVDVLRGLHAIHTSTGIGGAARVHGDVRPRNIVVGFDGTSRVASFRLRDVFDTSSDPELRNEMTAYSSPELLVAESLDVTADLFSVGVVLWEAVCHRTLFRGSTRTGTLYNVAAQSAPRLLDQAPSIPVQLSMLCSRLLAKTRSERPSSALVVARELVLIAQSSEQFASHADVAHEVMDRGRSHSPCEVKAAKPVPVPAEGPASPPPERTRLVPQPREWPRFLALAVTLYVLLALGFSLGANLRSANETIGTCTKSRVARAFSYASRFDFGFKMPR